SGYSAADLTKIGTLATYGTFVAKDNSLAAGTKNDRLAAVQGAIWQVSSGRTVTGAGLDVLIDNLSGNSYQTFFVNNNYGTIGSRFKLITPTVSPAVSGNQSFVIAVPEPATWAMMIMGFAGLGVMLRRQRSLAVA
ncbi:MAG: PEPxxWA-CTERM sorting domain-containing protein, partial [Alphaproteobacteria bacterium]